jgi:hypothetical protein
MPPGVLFFALALLFRATLAAGAEDISLRKLRTLAPPQLAAAGTASHELSLHLFIFSGTRWNADTVLAAIEQAAPLLSSCGVTLARADLYVIDAPRQFHVYFTPLSRRLTRAIDVARPALFFVDDTRNDPGFDAEAIGRGNSATRPELADTVWVTYGSRDLPYVLAHELVHVLSDSGEHSNEPGNLMREETTPRNARLSQAQCERLRSKGEANGLLKRR